MKKFHLFLLVSFFLILIWSGIRPHDYFTWFLEVLPALIGLALLAFFYKKFQFTSFTYFFIWLQANILSIGGHYTYALNPAGEWVKNIFNLERNHYDRLGHFMQGLVPALIIREIIIRKNIIPNRGWANFFTIAVCLAISAFYEFFEWWVAVGTGTAATAFLGTQGDVWDTQWDMFLALAGAVCAILFLSRFQDKALKNNQ